MDLISRVFGFDIFFKNTLRYLQTPFLILLALIFLGFMLKHEYDSEVSLRFSWLKQKSRRGLTLFVASVFCSAGYIALYQYSGSIQNWYTANLQIPLFIISVGVAWYFQEYYPRKEKITQGVFSAIALVTILLNLFSIYPVKTHGVWPHQQIMLTAGRYLNANPLNERIGAWNAGIIAYYEGGHIINLDGLVNNDIYPYAIKNELPVYLRKKDIGYVIDFEPMFTLYTKRGGYDDPDFLQRLEPIIQFDQGQFNWKFLTLYRVNNQP
ncbi:MAG: hypothetical protein IPL71_00580 [Anaerolineales bacterium]|uniref:hypothetical protein n=1 Tax=Candidatus Villigracilis proximus TaxID=3140683 RepID=UPI003134D9B7|nr:hypothetical protein [Anaerolineales bacterium]